MNSMWLLLLHWILNGFIMIRNLRHTCLLLISVWQQGFFTNRAMQTTCWYWYLKIFSASWEKDVTVAFKSKATVINESNLIRFSQAYWGYKVTSSAGRTNEFRFLYWKERGIILNLIRGTQHPGSQLRYGAYVHKPVSSQVSFVCHCSHIESFSVFLLDDGLGPKVTKLLCRDYFLPDTRTTLHLPIVTLN